MEVIEVSVEGVRGGVVAVIMVFIVPVCILILDPVGQWINLHLSGLSEFLLIRLHSCYHRLHN